MRAVNMRSMPVSSFALLMLFALIQHGCQSEVPPIDAFKSEAVNAFATDLEMKCVEILHEALESRDARIRLKAT